MTDLDKQYFKNSIGFLKEAIASLSFAKDNRARFYTSEIEKTITAINSEIATSEYNYEEIIEELRMYKSTLSKS